MRWWCVRESAMRLSVFVRAQRPAFHIHFPPSRPFSSHRPPPYLSSDFLSLGFFSSSRGLVWVIWFGAEEEKNLFLQKALEKSRVRASGGKPFVVKLDFHFEEKSMMGVDPSHPRTRAGESPRSCVFVGRKINFHFKC